MAKINVEIEGVVPLLQNRFQTENFGLEQTKAKKKVYIPEEDALKSCYKDDNGIFQPSEHILGCLKKAGTYFQYEGKKTHKDIVSMNVTVGPFNIPLLNSKGKRYDKWDSIDARRVCIQSASSAVLKYRPMYNEGWRLQFQLEIIDDNILSPATLRQILDKAGTIGIGDYRPRFGRFQVTKWEVLNETKTKT